MIVLYINNSNVIELQNLRNSVTDAADTGATVEVTLKDGAGVNVTGETWPVAMAHVSNGTYRATLSSALSVRRGGRYFAIVEATGSGAEEGSWEEEVTVSVRRS